MESWRCQVRGAAGPLLPGARGVHGGGRPGVRGGREGDGGALQVQLGPHGARLRRHPLHGGGRERALPVEQGPGAGRGLEKRAEGMAERWKTGGKPSKSLKEPAKSLEKRGKRHRHVAEASFNFNLSGVSRPFVVDVVPGSGILKPEERLKVPRPWPLLDSFHPHHLQILIKVMCTSCTLNTNT